MLSEVSQKKTNTVWSHLHMESKNTELIETGEWRLPGTEGDRPGKYVGQGNTLSDIRWISSGALMYSMVTTVNNTGSYTWKLLWEWSFNVLSITTKL